VKNFPHGIGEALGDALVTAATFRTDGVVLYVHHTGSDAYDGLDRVKPKATVGGAVSAAFAGDTVVLLPGHTETVMAQIAVPYRINLIGSGASGGIPTPTLTWGGASSVAMLDVTADGVLIGGIRFAPSTVTGTTTACIFVEANYFTLRGCYIECGANDDYGVVVETLMSAGTIEDTTFISTATVVTAQPVVAVYFLASPAESGSEGWYFDNVTFDGGTAGFSNFSAYDDTLSRSDLKLYEGVTLANGADMAIMAESNGVLNVVDSESGGMVDW